MTTANHTYSPLTVASLVAMFVVVISILPL
jgi:hypothetical protein